MSTAPTRATALLDTAEAILDGTIRISAGLQSRAAALLARQALEQALRDFWEKRAPGVQHCRIRTQIQCLAGYLDAAPVAAAATAWNRLSEACHHHPYAVAPSAAELRSWLGSVRVFSERVATQSDMEFDSRA